VDLNITMPLMKNVTVGLRVLTSLININHSNIIRLDLTRHFDLQLNTINDMEVNQYSYAKNGLNLYIIGWSCKSPINSNIKQVLVSNLNGLKIVKKASTIRTKDVY